VIPITRVVTMVMAGVVCFALLLPLALARHDVLLAVALIVIFVAYAGINVLLWLRMTRRAQR
jgi:hypothetical protein